MCVLFSSCNPRLGGRRLAAIGATLDRTGKSRGGYTPDLPPVPQYMTGGYLDPYGGLTPQFDPYSAAYGLPMQQQYAMPPQVCSRPFPTHLHTRMFVCHLCHLCHLYVPMRASRSFACMSVYDLHYGVSNTSWMST